MQLLVHEISAPELGKLVAFGISIMFAFQSHKRARISRMPHMHAAMRSTSSDATPRRVHPDGI